MPPFVLDFEFDEANTRKIEAHGITEDEVNSVLTNNPRFILNKRGGLVHIS